MSQLSQLLLFDPDPSGLDTLTYGFEKEGCSVTGTADVVKLRELIQSANPSLLLVNLGETERVGLELVRATTSNPRTRNLACVVIGRGDHRAAALSAGAFVFLSVPLFVRDVIAATRMVAAASVPGSRPSPETELSLSLGDVAGIYFLVRALAVTGRSAVVEVRHGQSRGELRVIDGTLASASAGTVQGLPALHRMLLWEEASLHFKFKNVVRRGAQLSMKSSEILEECDRFLRDFSHEARELGTARTRYTAALDRMQPSAAFPSEVVPVLKLFDGQRDLAQVLDDSPFRIFDTLKIIKRFASDGAIAPTGPGPAPPPDSAPVPAGPSALDFWLQKQTPVLGPEVAASGGREVRNGVAAGARADGGARVQSPFVVTAEAAASSNRGEVVSARTRTVTKKNVSEPPPSSPDAMENVITPPPASPNDSASQSRPNGAAVRGEFRIAAAGARSQEQPPSVVVDSALVEQAVFTPPAPMMSTAPPPVTAQQITAPPSVIIGSLAETTDPASSVPTPLAIPALAPAQQPQAQQPQHDAKPSARAPSDSFNDVESDFFEREADLYKRESVETFDDLDAGNRSNGRSRKR